MKNLILLSLFFIILSCKNENQEQVKMDNATDSLKVETKTILPDTVFFTDDEKSKWNDFALIYLLDKKYEKDSILNGTFRIDFKNKSKQTIASNIFKLRGVDEGAEWSGELELDSVASPLKRVDFGYPACGYTQNHFLFYVKKNQKADLVHEWYSNGDSGWGYWSEVISGNPDNFYFRTENFSPIDGSAQDEFGLDEYFDSIHFKLENKKWQKTFLTQKGKVYRSRKVKFDEFYKQN